MFLFSIFWSSCLLDSFIVLFLVSFLVVRRLLTHADDYYFQFCNFSHPASSDFWPPKDGPQITIFNHHFLNIFGPIFSIFFHFFCGPPHFLSKKCHFCQKRSFLDPGPPFFRPNPHFNRIPRWKKWRFFTFLTPKMAFLATFWGASRWLAKWASPLS